MYWKQPDRPVCAGWAYCDGCSEKNPEMLYPWWHRHCPHGSWSSKDSSTIIIINIVLFILQGIFGFVCWFRQWSPRNSWGWGVRKRRLWVCMQRRATIHYTLWKCERVHVTQFLQVTLFLLVYLAWCSYKEGGSEDVFEGHQKNHGKHLNQGPARTLPGSKALDLCLQANQAGSIVLGKPLPPQLNQALWSQDKPVHVPHTRAGPTKESEICSSGIQWVWSHSRATHAKEHSTTGTIDPPTPLQL